MIFGWWYTKCIIRWFLLMLSFVEFWWRSFNFCLVILDNFGTIWASVRFRSIMFAYSIVGWETYIFIPFGVKQITSEFRWVTVTPFNFRLVASSSIHVLIVLFTKSLSFKENLDVSLYFQEHEELVTGDHAITIPGPSHSRDIHLEPLLISDPFWPVKFLAFSHPNMTVYFRPDMAI